MDIQFEKIVRPGSFVLVCGKTGSGKTTLLKKWKKQLGEKAGMVMQNPDNQIVMDTVGAELSFGLSCKGEGKESVMRRIAETAAYFGLSRMLNNNTSTLSGGEKQLLNIASVIAADPDVLIFDEPVSMLDPVAAERILEIIKRINKEYLKTIIITEHAAGELFSMADSVMLVDKGELLFAKKPDEAAEYMAENGYINLLPVSARLFNKIKPVPLSLKEGRKYITGTLMKNRNECMENTDSREKLKKDTLSGLPVRLSMKNIFFSYEKKGRVILNGFSMKLYEGKVHVLMGENGSGKTTISRLITRKLKPYSGVVKSGGCTVRLLSQDVTDHFISDSYNGVHPYDISFGEQQKLALSLILKENPDIIILDEPAKGLDGFEKNNLINTINEHKKNGRTILVITHDTEFAAEVADLIYMVSDGRMVFEGSPKEFCSGNIFYTTSTQRMWKGISDNVITEKDAREWMK